MAKRHQQDPRAGRAVEDQVDEAYDAGEDGDDGDGAGGPDYTRWRWAAGALLVVGLVAVVAFAVKRSNDEVEAQRVEAERLKQEPARPVGPGGTGDVNYVLFCAEAQPGPNGMNIRGALDQIALPSFPMKVSFHVVVSVTADRPGRRYELVRFDRTGKADFAQELRVEAGTSVASVNVVPIKDFELPEARDVTFRVFRDGEQVAERVLRVNGQTAPVQPGKAIGGR